MKKSNSTSMTGAGLTAAGGRILALAFLAMLVCLGGRLPAQAADDTVLTTAAQVRALSETDAARHYPVKLRGVVTFYDDGLFSRFLQDATAGIYLQATNPLALQAGQEIEVDGVTDPGEFAPVVVPTAIRVLGAGTFPAAKPVALPDLLSGAEDSQMVEVSGNVRAAQFEKMTGNYYIDVVTGGERFTVIAKQIPAASPADLLDATVRVRGVCSTLFNRQRQLFGFRLLVPAADGLTVETPAPANPFEAAAQPIDSLLKFTPEGTPDQRIKVAGTVAYFEPGSAVFIEDGKLGLQCQTALRDALKPGDRVEVLGTPAKGEYSPILEDSIYRKVGDGTEPQADAVDLNEVLTGKHDCRLVQMSAKVLERVDRGIHQFLLLEADGFVFEAYLPRTADGDPLTDLANGSEVSVTGICLIERGNNWQAGKDWRAESFRLLLRSTADVKVLQAAADQDSPETTLWVVGAIEAAVLVAILLFWRKKARA